MDISQDCLEQYHGFQASFVQWLGVAARQCGFIFSRSPICQQARNNTKQKPGKPNRSVVKYLVPALELIEQAIFLKDSGRREAVIPAGIKWSLERTISLRESHSKVRNPQTTDPDDWAAHKGFIQVLKTCYNLLTDIPSKQISQERDISDDKPQTDSIRYVIAYPVAFAGIQGSSRATTDSRAATILSLSILKILKATTNPYLNLMNAALLQAQTVRWKCSSSNPRQSQRTTAFFATASFTTCTTLRIDC